MAEETNETTETPEAPAAEESATVENTSAEETLGDAGKKALKAEREARKTAEQELKDLREEVTRLRSSDDPAVDVEAIKSEIRAEFAAQLTEAAIKAEAKGRMTDPADALLYIKATDVADGEQAIKAAVDKLLTDKPYLAAQSGPHWGDVGQGQRSADKPEPRSAVERMARAYGASPR